MGDMVADPLDCIAAVDRKIFIEQLHAALDEALNRSHRSRAALSGGGFMRSDLRQGGRAEPHNAGHS